ncbi:MAG: twin-arginine translocase TatA/TatE family subunit [Gemmatimonadetes bacterium]|nr:twin-arginine translocase TatA/TatE family subunit [Gemmatimonadota bacterium]
MLVLFVVLLFLGAKRLPEIGGALGKGIREFKKSMSAIQSELEAPVNEVRREVTSGAKPAAEPKAQPAEKVQSSEGGTST